MKLKMLIKAAFKTSNFALLAGVVIVSIITKFFLPFILVGLAGYLYFVMQTLRSEKFISEFNQAEKLEGLQKMSWECNDLYRSLYKKIDRNLRNRASGIMKQKNELMEYFNKYSDNALKQTIIEKALKLVNAYLNLVYNYSIRSREITSVSVNEIINRINYNNRKLGTLKSYDAVLELTKTIEMDEKLLQRVKEEREELEQAGVKLDYIESTIGGFKHQIMSSDSEDPATDDIENVINEATALDNVLNERSKNRLKL
jgi:hypothetical protein